MSSFDFAKKELQVGRRKYIYYSLPSLEEQGLGAVSKLPFSVRIVLESLVRMQGHPAYHEDHVLSLVKWLETREHRVELPYMPSRVLLQDFTGVPAVVDLAALRSALVRAGHDPKKIEPHIPVDLIIDHSVQLDEVAHNEALDANLRREFERNRERYLLLKWGQEAFEKLRVLPPGLGICHQINMEYLAQCVTATKEHGRYVAFPDTLVGTDSHTVMINSMGVLGWGVGGIEAEAAMLGQPIPILTPVVTGVKLTGELLPGVTSTDVALAVTQKLREKGVVGQFVEYFGPGVGSLTLAARAPVANMAPEYGATTGFFPIDDATLDYLRETGRGKEQIDLVEHYCKEQGLFRTDDMPDPEFSDVVELDLSTIEAVTAGPRKPHEKVTIGALGQRFQELLTKQPDEGGFGVSAEQADKKVQVEDRGEMGHGSVIIASITSCTNTSNPDLMLGAGILARKAVTRGLTVPRHVRTSFAPGSRVVTEYLRESGLLYDLEQLGFHVVAYGCATCIGNSGPLAEPIANAIKDNDLVAASVLSGNRNFEGRIHALSKANFLASPPLVVAYALRGTVHANLKEEPIGKDREGHDVYLEDIWPTRDEIDSFMRLARNPKVYKRLYKDVSGPQAWQELPAGTGASYEWDEGSTYIQDPPFFHDFPAEAPGIGEIKDASVLGFFGDFITTDHISPAGSIPADGPAGRFLVGRDIQPQDFNSFGSRRGNHEVMMRGTFANIRIRNKLVDKEGGWTIYQPTGEEMSMYDAAVKYKADGTSLVVVAGKMYGAGSSRDWAAKGTYLLGVKAVIAESFERIHRSNLVEMGVLPLEFKEGQTADSLGLTGKEQFTIAGLDDSLAPGKDLHVTATKQDGGTIEFDAMCRIDTPIELEYYRHGGILQYVLRGVMEG